MHYTDIVVLIQVLMFLLIVQGVYVYRSLVDKVTLINLVT